MTEYKLYRQQRPVGKVELTREGLYYRIRCCCEPTKEILRLICKGCHGDVLVGVCGPAGWGFGIERRMPVKSFDSDPQEFYLQGQKERQRDFFELTHQLPDVLQDKLERCRFMVRDGVPGLYLTD